MNILFFRRGIPTLGLMLLLGPIALRAQRTAALDFSATTNASQVGGSFVTGYQFTVKSPITVNSLAAVLDQGPSKAIFGFLPSSMQVGLWDSSQKVLASATVFNTDPLVGNFNYAAVAPIILSPGQNYTVAGLVASGKSVLSNVSNLATNPQVTYLAPRSLISSTLAFPTGDAIGQPNGYFGASFGFVSQTGIVNFQMVSQSGPNATYRADYVNDGPALQSVTATATSLDSASLRVHPGQDTLLFAPVPANSQVTSSNTFTVQIKSDSVLDPSKLQWSFRTVAGASAAPITHAPTNPTAPSANAGPDRSVPVGSTVVLDASGSTGGAPLTYVWTLNSRPNGSAATLWAVNSSSPSFAADVEGRYELQLVVNNGSDASAPDTTAVTAVRLPMSGDIILPGSITVIKGRFTQCKLC